MNALPLVAILFLASAGCSAVTGPAASKEEINEARLELEVKSLDYQIGQVRRVNEIGYRLARDIPAEDIKINSRPFIGLFTLSRTKTAQRLFGVTTTRGVFVAFVLRDTPSAAAGVKKGDVVLAVDHKEVNRVQDVVRRIEKLSPGKTTILTLLCDGQPRDIPVSVASLPVNVRFTAVDKQGVNAAAGNNRIYVTYGLLNFTRSDDEIAAVLAHELAHLARSHVRNMNGKTALNVVVAVGLGLTAEVFQPGSGHIVMRGVNGIGDVFRARYSRDLEREADYFSVKILHAAGYDPEVAVTIHERFAVQIPRTMISGFLSTHPGSPERTVRIRKAIDELQNDPMKKTG